uniref:BPTI/Kunitz inhibitor domain-containing protein n=1 Tax=Takifugu rubripes TaxID=31033 RepID=A0A674N9Q3_TAKRU
RPEITWENLPSLQGPCKAYEPRWAYNSGLKKCQSFVYGGCGGNENNFESREACEQMCGYGDKIPSMLAAYPQAYVGTQSVLL